MIPQSEKNFTQRKERINNTEHIKWLLNVGLIFVVFCIKNSNNEPYEVNAYNEMENVLPKHYNIRLIPNMEKENRNFKGSLIASFEIRRNTHNFIINFLHLEINETVTFVRDSYNEKYKPEEYYYDNMKEMLILNFKEELPKGNYVLVTNFTGVSTKDIGFYTKSYTSHEGLQMVAVTQTEDFTARQIFPCWDEPGLKTTFDISVKHNKKYKVLSNVPEKQTSQKQLEISETNDTWTEFEITSRISPHLVAIVVFDPVDISNVFTSETVNIWCRPNLLSKTELNFVHDVVKNVTKHLINYTLFSNVSTINIVLLPDSIITKTVSGWALIIYRESDFIQKNEDIPGMRKKHIVNLIAEHVVRHWFGNLITPSKWTWLWLRDGFVTFFKSYILNMIFKDWRTMDMLVVEDIHSALYYDIKSFYMTAIVSNNDRFVLSQLKNNEYTSYTTSKKASAILRMLQFITSNAVFQIGIINYLNENAYNSTTSEGVWSSMQHSLRKSNMNSKTGKSFNVRTVMDAYMKKTHYPLVLVERDYETGETTITQECFSSQKVDTKWWIPLSFATQTDPDFFQTTFTWLSPEDENVTLKIEPNDWIIVNLQQYGYYRVNYDKTNWQKITDYLNSDEYVNIHVLNRAQLIDDAFTLVRYQKINVSIFLNLTKYLRRETDYIVWHTTFRILALLSDYFLLPESKNLRSHFSEILGSRLEKLGYEEDPNENNFTKIERLNATYWACYFGNTKCRSMATSKLLKYIDDPANYNILPHWQEWTLCAGLMAANLTIWKRAKDIYFEKSDQRFYEYLACVEDPKIIQSYLNIWEYSKNSVMQNDQVDIMFHFIVKKHGRNDEILNYILKNFETLIPDSSLRFNKIYYVILHVHSLTQLKKVENFVNDKFKLLPHLLAELRDIIEIRKNNLKFEVNFFTTRFFS